MTTQQKPCNPSHALKEETQTGEDQWKGEGSIPSTPPAAPLGAAAGKRLWLPTSETTQGSLAEYGADDISITSPLKILARKLFKENALFNAKEAGKV